MPTEPPSGKLPQAKFPAGILWVILHGRPMGRSLPILRKAHTQMVRLFLKCKSWMGQQNLLAHNSGGRLSAWRGCGMGAGLYLLPERASAVHLRSGISRTRVARLTGLLTI